MTTFCAIERVGKNDYRMTCYMNEAGEVTGFECQSMDYLRTKTLPEMLKAIKKKEDADKRGFKNPTAYMVESGYGSPEKILDVTVTSIRDDKTVWVSYGKGKGGSQKRGTEGMQRLYADKELLSAALEEKKTLYRRVEKMFADIPRWSPIPKDEEKS